MRTAASRTRKYRSRSGFTIAELMVVLGVVTILLALLVPNLIALRKNLRQTELDAKAEILYTAAQNQLVKLRAAGRPDVYAGVSSLPAQPSDAVGMDSTGQAIVRALYYTCPGDAAGDALLDESGVDAELLLHSWVIEYEPSSAAVYAVYYGEERDVAAGYRADWVKYDELRTREERLRDGALVGYYGGDVASGGGTGTSQLKPTIDVRNGETLTAFLQCTAPKSTDELTFTLTIADSHGHSVKRTYTKSTVPQVKQAGRSFYVELTLDDLRSDETRFNALYGSGSGRSAAEQLVAGDRLVLTLTVNSTSGLIEPSAPVRAQTNGLFDDESDSTALIACGRHLQNLDTSSGVTPAIVAATQTRNIDFEDIASGLWQDRYSGGYFNGTQYGEPKFRPISNPNLTAYEGAQYRVIGLCAGSDGSAGLFAAMNGGMTLRGVRLTGARVQGDIAGALAGSVSGAGNVIEDCRVYLERGDFLDRDDQYVWIDGTSFAGGLVGVTGSGSLSITDSFAATVIRAGSAGRAGGLAAESGGSLSVARCYADCYLTGQHTGGLVGGGSGVNLSDCYAAGFQTAQTAAGLVNGVMSGARRCYTISAPDDDGTAMYSTARTASVSAGDKVYWFTGSSDPSNDLAGTLHIGNMTSAQLQEIMGSAFLTDTADTVAYNLRSQGLTAYPYPRLVGSRHYGDWQADFQTGALVYYEKYLRADRDYGFHGGNVSTLTEGGTVVGDGYGVVFRRGGGSAIPDSVRVALNGGAQQTLYASSGFDVRDPDTGTVYFIIPLPKAALNAEPPTAGTFYQSASVTVGSTLPVSFWFNPHFAKTAVNDTGSLPPVEEISIRTPRHLDGLSRYYDDFYAEATNECVFRQERDVSFSAYDWTGYTEHDDVVSVQAPIGRSLSSPFRAEYNGGNRTITDVSFITEDGDYVGMFGYNAGKLRNIVLTTAYDPNATDHYYVQRERNMRPNEPVYMGVLAGYNGVTGTVNNCAVAGYYLAGSDSTLHAYENCVLYAGGLVGGNDGVIRNCSADCPGMRLSSVFATVYMGGFAGWNDAGGTVSDCYALGHLEVADTRGGTVGVAGFAGRNEGRISQSYCAVSLVAGGVAVTSGFSPKGGLVTDCLYLDRGTYSYVDHLRAYNSNADATSGVPVTYDQLRAARKGAVVSRTGSLWHPNTNSDKSTAYPFRPVVKDRLGRWVHYGDWQVTPAMGVLGIFYWEREENGSNAGYHFTYLGTSEGNADSGTSLCTAHDDGGVITEYGYGYYVQRGEESSVTLTSDGIAIGRGVNSFAKAALEEQIAGFTFYPYTTRVSSTGQYVYLNNGRSRTGRWTLRYDDYTYTYELTPFFANAMRRVDTSSSIEVTASDWRRTDYSRAPGSVDNTFEVRSVQQLRYINWNCTTMNCDTLVYGAENQPDTGNYRDFPYLQYATVLTKGIQSRAAVEALRPAQYWVQSHDLKGDNAPMTPIAGMATSSPFAPSTYRNFLFAWFGGNYDGQSYKIQNLTVESEAYSVGLFGATAGANIKNIILFADDNTSHICRDTAGKTAVSVAGQTLNFERGPGAYFLGGLVGIAYEYSGGSEITNKIENCAIAGYRVVDRSTNQQGAGTANVGGLIGLANVNLEKCSSVAEIVLDCTHDYGHMAFGSYIRVGGLAGSAGAPGAELLVSSCYTGGSIRVTERTLNETPPLDGNGYAIRDKGNVGYSLNIFISGIIGGSYAPNISNFTAQETNAPDGTANIENCYTYLKLPDLRGTIRAVSYVANPGDRYGRGSKINVTNCYHLASVNADIAYDPAPAYFFQPNKSRRVITDAEFTEMLNGDLTCLNVLLNKQGGARAQQLTPAVAVGFEELSDAGMAAALGPAWGWITATEGGGAAIDGKYSFSSNAGQEGKNYPFPTVLQQKDLTFSTADRPVYVNVHYGEWPVSAYEWANGRDTMDLFADADISGLGESAEGPWAEKSFRLSYARATEFHGENLVFNPDPDDRWELVGYTRNEDEQYFDVTIRAKKPGSAVIREETSGASFTVNITAELDVTADTQELLLYHSTPRQTQFTARAALPKETEAALRADYTNAPCGTWSFESDETLVESEQVGDAPAVRTVTGHAPGRHVLTANYTYDYHGTPVTQTLFLPVRTLGYVGLSNGVAHTSARRSSAGLPAEIIDGAYGGTPLRPAGADVFLFATEADGDLAEFTVNRITVTDAGNGESWTVYDTAPGASVDTSRYTAHFLTDGDAPDVRSDEEFAYWGAAVRYLPDDGGGERPVSVTVELTDPNGSGRYVFSVPMSSVPSRAVSFNAAGGVGVMQDEGLTGDSYTVPECNFTRKGYNFNGWDYGGAVVQPGDELTGLSGSIVLIARWTPKLYVIHFDPNGGGGDRMPDMVLAYDDDPTPLTANTYTAPEEGQSFDCWVAHIDDARYTFADGEAVANLTDGTDVIMFATWKSGDRQLLLVANGLTVEYQPGAGASALTDYVAPTRAGWTLDGWYTEPSASGEKVLNASGEVVADVEGYTADGALAITDDRTLYAKWTGSAFLQIETMSEGCDGDYLISNADSGEVRLMANADSSNATANFTSLTATVVTQSAVDEDGNAVGAFIPAEGITNAAKWHFNSTMSVKSAYAFPRYMILNCNGLAIRDHGSSLQMRNSANWSWNGDISNRCLWTFNTAEAGKLESQYAHAESKAHTSLGWNGSKWTVGANLVSYLYREQTISIFG